MVPISRPANRNDALRVKLVALIRCTHARACVPAVCVPAACVPGATRPPPSDDATHGPPPARCACPARYSLSEPAQGHLPARCAWPARSRERNGHSDPARPIDRARIDDLTLSEAMNGPVIGDKWPLHHPQRAPHARLAGRPGDRAAPRPAPRSSRAPPRDRAAPGAHAHAPGPGRWRPSGTLRYHSPAARRNRAARAASSVG